MGLMSIARTEQVSRSANFELRGDGTALRDMTQIAYVDVLALEAMGSGCEGEGIYTLKISPRVTHSSIKKSTHSNI
jgi:hypothetical protein